MAPRNNRLALAVLLCLLERPMHPYEIAQTLRSRAKEESVRLNYGSLYGVVESLEKRGLIRARETVREGRRPERTIYEVTPGGEREASEWLEDLVAVPVKEFPAFMAALSFLAGLPPDDALEALRQRLRVLEIKLAQAEGVTRAAAEAGLPRIFSLEHEYEMALTVAERDFVRKLVEEMASGSLEGLEQWRHYHQPD